MVRYIYYNGVFTKLPSYIYINKNGYFEIRKKIGGILQYWGCFLTLEEAKMYRAFYIGKNWMVNPHFRKPHYICEQDGHFIIRKRQNGRLNYFGSFDNIADAENERDICRACNWDMDMIVEFGDSIEV